MARPLTKTYRPAKPYVIVRTDLDDGRIAYEIWDERPESYHRLCTIYEDDAGEDIGDRSEARRDAQLIVAALNATVSGEVSDRLKGERKV